MRERIDSRCGDDALWKTSDHIDVEDNSVGDERGIDDAFFTAFFGDRDDRVLGRFRTGTACRRNKNRSHTFLCKRRIVYQIEYHIPRTDKNGSQFCRIHSAAAADSDDEIALHSARFFYNRIDIIDGRFGCDTVEYSAVDVLSFQNCDNSVAKTCRPDAFIRKQKDALYGIALYNVGKFFNTARPRMQFRRYFQTTYHISFLTPFRRDYILIKNRHIR